MKNAALQGRGRLVAGCLFLALVLGAAAWGPWLAPHDPLAPNLGHRLAAPSWQYPLGTDQLGRCVFSRVLTGARLSVGGALLTSLLALLMGAGVGLLSGLGGRWPAALLTALIDLALALPSLILALVLAGLLGASWSSLVLGIALATWAWWARLLRGLALSAREKEYVLAARVVGLRGWRLLARYILPQMRAPVLAAAALKTGWIILAFSGLSYLGLGPPPPAPEWGAMLHDSRIYLAQAPWLMLAPGGAVTLTVLALNLVGEGLQEPERDLMVREGH